MSKSKKKTCARCGLLGLVSGAVLVLLVSIYLVTLAPKKTYLSSEPACDLAKENTNGCTLTLADGSEIFRVQILGERLRDRLTLKKALVIRIFALKKDIQPLSLSANIIGTSMPMGPYPLDFKESPSGHFEARLRLDLCDERTMDWRMVLSANLESSKTRYFGLLDFSTFNPFEKPPLPNASAGPVELMGQDRFFSLADFIGRPSIWYFGFTRCPDVCPVSLSRLAAIYRNLPPKKRAGLDLVFVSVDHGRDTPESVTHYAARYSSKILALTGDKNNIERISSFFGVFFEFVPLESELKYTVDHTSRFFLLDKHGKVSLVLEDNISSEKFHEKVDPYL